MTTTTQKDTVQSALDRADPNQVADALQQIKLGTVLTPLKRSFTGLASSATQDLTAIDATGETVGADNPNRLAALAVVALSDATGAMLVADSGATPMAIGAHNNGVATLSDDGKTITFPSAQTAFEIVYVPRASVDMASDFAPSS